MKYRPVINTAFEQSDKLLLGAIAGISLLVGGHRGHEYHAGISEETKKEESEIRKALGAEGAEDWGTILLERLRC